MRISCLSRADFLDEDALEEPEQLAHYKAIIVTQPNVPAAGTRGLLAWVTDAGGMSYEYLGPVMEECLAVLP